MRQAAEKELLRLVKSKQSSSEADRQCDRLMWVVHKRAGDHAAPTVPTVEANGQVGERVYPNTDDEPERTNPW